VVAANRGKLRELAAAGIALLLVVPRRWRSRDVARVLPVERTPERFRMAVVSVCFVGYGALVVYNPLRLLWIAWRFRPHLIQVEEEPWSLAAFEAAVIGRLLRVPVVFFTWENLDRKLPIASRLVRRAVLRQSAAAIAGSREARQRLEDAGFRRPIAVIPQLGVDPHAFAPAHSARDDRGFAIGYVGRLVPEKGLRVLLEAAAMLPEVVVLVVGGGPLRGEIVSRAAEMGLGGRVRMYDGVGHKDVPDYLRQMDVLVLPSITTPAWKEQFGHVLIEAMACGVPVIGSDSGAIPDVIGDAGIVVPQGDAKALAAAVRRLMDDHTLRHDLSERGRARARAEFSDAEIAARTARLWRAVAERA
jgi:glycosyltransferase involved in cell wall biosynthesis